MDPISELLKVDTERMRGWLPEGLKGLADVVWNLAWSWLPDAESLFREVDKSLWDATDHNPRATLELAGAARLQQLATDPVFLRRTEALVERFQAYMSAPPSDPAQRVIDRYGGAPVAYFSAEFGIHEAVPLYSGGLGLLAGDHLKSASDLGLPLVGVSLRYRQGYFKQNLDPSGWQQEIYEDTNFGRLPIGLLLKGDGTPMTVSIPYRRRWVTLQLWGMRVGRVTLLVLDSDREDNHPEDRWITGHLYGGDRSTRIAQEMVLGIGGVRALRALGYDPAVFHMNEGHAAFLGLELMHEATVQGQNWEQALETARQKSVFTTHTPVPAGHDIFQFDLFDDAMGSYLANAALPRDAVINLGRVHPNDWHEPFGMTPLALRASRSTNGVSRLHGEVSRRMWQGMYPGTDADQVPITHVTNGVHLGTWMAPLLQELLTRYLGEGWQQRQYDPATWAAVDQIPDAELWDVHRRLKRTLLGFAREHVRAYRESMGMPAEYLNAADQMFDEDALTLGFARRAATYKRLPILLQNRERALRLLGQPERPVQILISGKSHPGDNGGKASIQYITSVRHDPRAMKHAAFLVNYNIAVARPLVQGVDMWLNLPRRMEEASGTSGMKVMLNGGLNCSVLDGWWAEGYEPGTGWPIGEGPEIGHPPGQDEKDAEALYTLLENEIVPMYFDRDADGVPRRWVAMMKASLKALGPRFTTERMVADYANQIYAP